MHPRGLGREQGINCRCHLVGFSEISEQNIRLSGFQLFIADTPGCHRNHMSPESAGTGNVFERVSDNHRTLRIEALATHTFGPINCNRAQFISLGMIIPVGSETKVMIDFEMPQFKSGSGFNIPGQQSHEAITAPFQLAKQFRNTGQKSSLSPIPEIIHAPVESYNVVVKKELTVTVVIIDFKMLKKECDDAAIGRPPKIKRWKILPATMRKRFEKTLL